MATVDFDPTVMFIWRYANRETSLSLCSEIAPIHFLISILSAIDGLNPFRDALSSDEAIAWEKIQNNVPLALEILQTNLAGVTKQRRHLFHHLHRVNYHDNDVQYMRSQESLRLFNRAIKKAQINAIDSISFLDLLMELRQISIEDEIINIRKNIEIEPSLSEIDATQNLTTYKEPSSMILNNIGRNLTKLARQGKFTSVVYREKEIHALARCLVKTKKSSALLLGSAGVGKTAIVEGLAQWITSPNAPQELKNIEIIQINAADLIADTSFRGQLEKRVMDIIHEVEHNPNIIIFIDEIHMISSSNRYASNSVDISNMLKAALAGDSFRCIGATTQEEFLLYLQSDRALIRRFQIIQVTEPDSDATKKICLEYAKVLSLKKGVFIPTTTVDGAILLADNYLPNRFQPDKTIDLLESAAAYVILEKPVSRNLHIVDVSDIWVILTEHFGIVKREKVNDEKLLGLLNKGLSSQPEAIEKIHFFLNRIGQLTKESPLPVLYLIGSKKAGLNQISDILANSLSGEIGDHICEIELSDFCREMDAIKLFGFGASPVDQINRGIIETQVLKHTGSVFILNQFDDAHPYIQEKLIQVIDKKKYRNSRGEFVSLSNCVFILTSISEREELSRKNDGKLSEAQMREVSEFSIMDLMGKVGNKIFDTSTIVYIRIADEQDYRTFFDDAIATMANHYQQKSSFKIILSETDRLNIFLFFFQQSTTLFSFILNFAQKFLLPISDYIDTKVGFDDIVISWQNNNIAYK